MSAPKITLPNLFDGWRLAGLDPDEYEVLTDNEKLAYQLQFIERRAAALMGLPENREKGIHAEVLGEARRLHRAAKSALDLFQRGGPHLAAGKSIDVGWSLGRIQAHLVIAHTIDVTRQVKKHEQGVEQRKQQNSKNAQQKKGREGKLKKTVRRLFRDNTGLDIASLREEFEADCMNRESQIEYLRNINEAFIKIVEYWDDEFQYDEIGGKSGKRVKVRRLENILSELRKEK